MSRDVRSRTADADVGGPRTGHDLGGYIRARRAALRLSLRELSRLTGVSDTHLSHIERGLRHPSGEVLQAIAGALAVPSASLYARAGVLDVDTPVNDVVTALADDQQLRPDQRAALLELYRSFIARGEAG